MGEKNTKYKTIYNHYKNLSNENIKNAIQMTDAFLAENGIDYEQKARHAQFLETVLLKYSEINRKAPFHIVTHRTYKKVVISLHVRNGSYNLMEENEDVFSDEFQGEMDFSPRGQFFQKGEGSHY